ncbi:MAG TPA: hypothetical protein VIM60_06155, partial [Edaphobacter sp.]
LGVAQQTPAAAKPHTAEPAKHGQVLFHRSDDAEQTGQAEATKPTQTPPRVVATITDAQRSAVRFTAWDLDLHIAPDTSHLSARARFTVVNEGKEPLKALTLQLSSTLNWESIGAPSPLTFTQHTLDTDADHTGQVTEALVALPTPLPPRGNLTLTAFYSGTVPHSAVRLTRIGAPTEQAARLDWDSIAEDSVALRGFGQVIWYPVSSPALFLGDGAKLFQAIGQSRLQQASSTLAVRLSVEYAGDPPVSVFLNGQRQPAEHVTEEPNAPVAESHGVATASFAAAPIGFRTPSLFVSWHEPKPTEDQLLAPVTDRPEAVAPYDAAAGEVAPLLKAWLGASPLTPLTLLDHPGQPFEDDALLVSPLTATDAKQIAPMLVHSLTHAWFRSSLPWLNEGVPQFMAVMESEGTDGRDKSLVGLRGLIVPLTLMEPEPDGAPEKPAPQLAEQTPAPTNQTTNIPFDPRNLPGPPQSYSSSTSSSSSSATSSSSTDSPSNRDNEPPQALPSTVAPPPGQPGQSLIAAHDEAYYRAKAAAVLVMLRSIVGDDAMKQALKSYREYARKANAEHPEDPHEFQRVLEQTYGKSLGWLFDDWVYNDRGLADLSVVGVTPRSLVSKSKNTSWLVAVEIRNQGNVNVEVPVTVRSGNLTSTERVRIAPQSTTSTRILFEGTPQEVLVNDGTVPETVAPIHLFNVRVPLTE